MRSHDPGIIIEFSRMGAYVKVSAFHEATMTEVSIVGDPRETEQRLKQTVIKKLNYVLNKQNADKSGTKKIARDTTRDTKGGIVV
ncbi:hypothetical protein WH95_15865 [Kiloniella litopenaei]|uniref:DUF6898 domain-containing protein n=1 Tax=Kiloniella litopenaei TaxID=1549748 RepID=A0A0M2R8J8_9PROT|nr:hypothetical protein [Kiloniella litopenaei]KKJ75868.1 hypothetical protein WH95_15865 [Kiloniella litopenaei]